MIQTLLVGVIRVFPAGVIQSPWWDVIWNHPRGCDSDSPAAGNQSVHGGCYQSLPGGCHSQSPWWGSFTVTLVGVTWTLPGGVSQTLLLGVIRVPGGRSFGIIPGGVSQTLLLGGIQKSS